MTQHPCEKLIELRAIVNEMFGEGTPLEIDLPPQIYYEVVRHAEPSEGRDPRGRPRPFFQGIQINEQRISPRPIRRYIP